MSRLRAPLKNVRGLGSAKAGTEHFMQQRITAVALLLTGAYVIGLLLCNLQGGFDAMHAALAHPISAVVVIAFLIAMCWHASLGIQVVIEDYVHTPKWLITSILLNKFIFAIAAIAGVLAVLKISLGAMGN